MKTNFFKIIQPSAINNSFDVLKGTFVRSPSFIVSARFGRCTLYRVGGSVSQAMFSVFVNHLLRCELEGFKSE